MSHYLANLVARSFTRAEAIQPRLPSRFEPITLGAMADAASAMDMTIAQESVEEQSAVVHRRSHAVEDVRSATPASAPRQPHREDATGTQPKSSWPDAQITPTDAAFASEGEETETNARDEQPSPPLRRPIQVAVVARDPSSAAQESKREARPAAVSSLGAIRPVTESAFGAELQAASGDSESRQASQATAQREVVQVMIGRIEVRAVTPAPQAKPQAAPRANTLSLTDYLNGKTGDRAGGGR